MENDNLDKKINYLTHELDNSIGADPPNPLMSDKAFERLKEKINLYVSDLITESIKNAKREKLDSVSASHIEKASDYLVSSTRSKVNKLIVSVGGLLLGATVSNVVNMVLKGGDMSVTGVVLTVILGVVGAFLLSTNK